MQQNANNKTMLFYKYEVYVYLYLKKIYFTPNSLAD